MKKNLSFDSLCVHDVKAQETTRSHQIPIYPTSSFEFESIDQGIAIFKGEEQGHIYGRFGNPTIDAVQQKLAKLETYGLDMEAECLLLSSGMSAISTMAFATLKTGEKILTQGNLYGGTTELFTKVLGPMGIETLMINLQDLELVENTLKADSSIKMLYFETPANPSMACVDMEALTKLGTQYGAYVAVDNTFCTPYIQQPFKYSVDFVIHSTTKYLNGHGNGISGALIGKDVELMKNVVWRTMKLAGTNCNPWDAWLINNGLKTLTVRMDKHSQNALKIAQFMEKHPKVEKVNYVGLTSHPEYELAQKQMTQGGGMLSFELKGGLEAGIQMMNKIEFCTMAPTLGDVDTLVLHPASMSHLNIPKEIRLRNGITDGLIRLSVGIEDADDIIDDLVNSIGE
ncbi:MAG: aminotransferase class I/II-fold pyridoxal phosphate-dependent enzyme [Bacteroidota bacterium]